MAFLFSKIFPNVSRHSNAARAAAELANALNVFNMSRSFSATGIAGGTTAAKVKTVNALQYSVQGAQFTKAATDDFWTLSGTVVAVNSFQKYLLLIDTAGAASIQEGVQSIVSAASVAWTNISGISAWSPILSLLGPGAKAIVGVVTVATDATHTFTPGTTALNATGITSTFVNGIDQSLVLSLANQQGVIIGNGS